MSSPKLNCINFESFVVFADDLFLFEEDVFVVRALEIQMGICLPFKHHFEENPRRNQR